MSPSPPASSRPPRGLPRSEEIRARPWEGSRPPGRILAIRLHALGDTVLTLPYLKAVRRRYPEARIDFLTRHEVAGVPRSVGIFDRVLVLGGGRDPGRTAVSAILQLPALLATRYDVVLDLQRSRLSGALRRVLRPRAWAEYDRFSPEHAGERTRRTIEAAGLGPLTPCADVRPEDREAGVRHLRRAGWDGSAPLVVLNPAGAFEDRAWPVASWTRFARRWTEEVDGAAAFLLLGVAARAERARALKRALGDRVFDLVGATTVAEAFAIVARSTLVVSEDSGLMHMAWIAGVPTLAVFGAGRGGWARPLGARSAWIRTCRQAEERCFEMGCAAGRPPCVVGLDPEVVVARAREVLRRDRHPRDAIFAEGRLVGPPADEPPVGSG